MILDHFSAAKIRYFSITSKFSVENLLMVMFMTTKLTKGHETV